MSAEPQGRSIPDILGHLVRQIMGLIRNEGQLARAEISEKIDKLTGAALILGAGAVLLLPGVVIVLEAIVAALIQAGWRAAAAALVVGAVTLLVGGLMCVIGLRRLKSVGLVPEKTLRQIQQDVAVATETRYDNDVERAA